jgi:hypothetical protein
MPVFLPLSTAAAASSPESACSQRLSAHLELQAFVVDARHQRGVAAGDGRHDAAVGLLA